MSNQNEMPEQTEPQDKPIQRETIVVTEGKSSGTNGWFVMFTVLAAVLVGLWAFTQLGGAEMAKDNAVADAAEEVGRAAGEVGDAARDIGDAAQDAADSVSDS